MQYQKRERERTREMLYRTAGTLNKGGSGWQYQALIHLSVATHVRYNIGKMTIVMTGHVVSRE